MTCVHCGHTATPAYWNLIAGELYCPVCGRPENDRLAALQDLEAGGDECATADLFHEKADLFMETRH